ncbi:IclR family transcriptional regulator [Microtetraspora fusca]|uniref:IclR family transcriptional regulator n=1 Tax=Microtetraspora fusca TaxID=1997 RepID=UPI00082B494C|nr:IclR family transcriptional regulator C-terminal domain-containing protein [Microtetraspora fusca]
MSESAEPTAIRTVERALRLAHIVAISSGGLTLTAAAREAELALSTAARLLKALELSGFAWRDSSGLYHPGPRMLQAGAIALGHLPVYKIAEPHLRDLADFTGETAYLAVAEGDSHALYLRQVESPRAIRHATWAGRAIPTVGTAVGAALNGRLSEGGYAVSRRTAVEPEAAAAAAPVYDSAGGVVAALSIIGPSFRISEEDLASYAKAVAEHAQALSAELGFPGFTR